VPPLLVWVLLTGCHGGGKPDPALGGDDSATTATTTLPGRRQPSPMRRLSVQEIRNSIPLVTGVDPQDALARLPPDALDAGYDRVAEAQTVSAVHLEAFDALADAVAEALITELRLDDLTPACPDAILPPFTAASTTTLPATGLTGSPSWAMTVADDHVGFLYSDTVTVTTTFAAPVGGLYRFTFPVTIDNSRDFPDVTLSIDGVRAASWTATSGYQSLTADVSIADAHSVSIQLDFAAGDRGWSERTMEIWSPTVEGPLDPDAGVYTAERQACADALIPALATRAWRRPPTPDEVARLTGVWQAGIADGTEADGLAMIVEAILLSPNFLYLVEVGEPVADRPGWYRLTDDEQAARLSYALCEEPPDATLTAAAAAGELRSADQVEAQARRLLDADCGHATITRFHRQWLQLSELDSLARDPDYYPEVTAGLGTAMREDTEYFLDRMVYDEAAGLQAIWEADYTWVGPDTAWLYGLTADAAHTRVDLPADRAGPLTQPGILAATSKFSETSPVLRGVYVLERLLCADLSPPPANLDITAPELDDTMTTRERWEAHSSDPACSGCHSAIDPIGFALEGYDAIGRTRTEENGLPIDTSGGIPLLGVTDISGGVAVAEAIAGSSDLRHCFARQWMRDGLGHLEDETVDADTLDPIDAAAETSVYEALVALTRSDRFLHRVVAEEIP
jgi:hypothetical protein